MSQENLLLLFPFNHVLSIVPPQELPFRNLARGKFLLSSAKRRGNLTHVHQLRKLMYLDLNLRTKIILMKKE